MTRRPELVVLAAALALRVAHALTIGGDPLFDVLPLDSESYDTWAREILAGRLGRDAPFYQAPLYAYALAALHALTGGDLLAPRLANALLGTVHVALVMQLGSRLFGRGAGLAAGALCAAYAPFLFEEGKVMKTALGLVFSTGALALLVEARRRGDSLRFALASGAACGLAALVRENFLLVAAAFAALLAVRPRRPRGRLAAPVLLLGGTALAIAPVTWHNFAVSGEIIAVTSQAGQNFYIGNHAGNPHGGYLVPDFVRRSPRFEEIDFAAEAERRAGRALSPSETSRFWFGEAVRDLRADPMRFPRNFATKLGLLFDDFEIPDDQDLRFFRRYAPVLRLPLVGFALVGVLGLLGFAARSRRRTLPAELFVFIAAYAASVALFFVFARYRLPLVAPLAVLAGDRVAALARAVRARRPSTIARHAAAAVPLALFVLRPIDEGTTFANSHLAAGIAYEVKGRAGDAAAEYAAGLALEPSNAKLLRRAARLAAQEEPASEAARTLLRRALEANPDDAEIAFRAATALAIAGERAEAAALFESIRARGGAPPGLDANLAMLYEEMARFDEAAEAAARALAIDPQDEEMKRLRERVEAAPRETAR